LHPRLAEKIPVLTQLRIILPRGCHRSFWRGRRSPFPFPCGPWTPCTWHRRTSSVPRSRPSR